MSKVLFEEVVKVDYEQVGKVEALLTSLKYDSMNLDYDPFGNSKADKQIKAICEALKIFGARAVFEGPEFKARIIFD